MIRLDLTAQQADALQQWLASALQRQPVPDDHSLLHALRDQLTRAQAALSPQTLCPVCAQPFAQRNVGRTARYCSPACKQKAYRQRRHAWQRRVRPYPNR